MKDHNPKKQISNVVADTVVQLYHNRHEGESHRKKGVGLDGPHIHQTPEKNEHQHFNEKLYRWYDTIGQMHLPDGPTTHMAILNDRQFCSTCKPHELYKQLTLVTRKNFPEIPITIARKCAGDGLKHSGIAVHKCTTDYI